MTQYIIKPIDITKTKYQVYNKTYDRLLKPIYSKRETALKKAKTLNKKSKTKLPKIEYF